MDASREQELRESLRRELERQATGLGRAARAAWLLAQVENYVERWLGMRAASPMPPAVDDLFRMIEIGAEAATPEVQAASAPDARRWWEFLAALAAVRGGGDGVDPSMLAKTLAAARSMLRS